MAHLPDDSPQEWLELARQSPGMRERYDTSYALTEEPEHERSGLTSPSDSPASGQLLTIRDLNELALADINLRLREHSLQDDLAKEVEATGLRERYAPRIDELSRAVARISRPELRAQWLAGQSRRFEESIATIDRRAEDLAREREMADALDSLSLIEEYFGAQTFRENEHENRSPTYQSVTKNEDLTAEGARARLPGAQVAKGTPPSGASHENLNKGAREGAIGDSTEFSDTRRTNTAHCEIQLKQDIFQCNMVGLRACYAQAMQRYAACLAGTRIPPFNY